MNNTKKGFTLVELLVVIAILAILATVSVVGYTSFIDRANQSNADTEAAQLKSIIEYSLMDTTTGAVKLSENLYVTGYETNASGQKTGYKIETTYTVVSGKRVIDATADLTEAGGTLVQSGTDLKYSHHGYDVLLFANTSSKTPTGN